MFTIPRMFTLTWCRTSAPCYTAKVVDISASAVSSFHTCAILVGGVLKCWGLNNYGQLGLGDTIPRGNSGGSMGCSLPAVDLGAGRTAELVGTGGLDSDQTPSGHTCALLDNGTAVIDAVLKSRPASAKGRFLENLTLAATMSPGLRVDAAPFLKF